MFARDPVKISSQTECALSVVDIFFYFISNV